MRSRLITVIVYGKPGCHLCEDVRTLFDEVAEELGFDLRAVDITTDAGLHAQYRYEIPVVTADGAEIGRGRLDEREWLARLRASLRAQ